MRKREYWKIGDSVLVKETIDDIVVSFEDYPETYPGYVGILKKLGDQKYAVYVMDEDSEKNKKEQEQLTQIKEKRNIVENLIDYLNASERETNMCVQTKEAEESLEDPKYVTVEKVVSVPGIDLSSGESCTTSALKIIERIYHKNCDYLRSTQVPAYILMLTKLLSNVSSTDEFINNIKLARDYLNSILEAK